MRPIQRLATAVTALAVAVPLLGAAAPPPAPETPGRVLDEVLVPKAAGDPPGVTYREFTTTDVAGRVRGDLLAVDLTNPAVRVDLLRPAAVAATATVLSMASRANALGGINGGFFDEGGTGAAAGAEIVDGAPRKAAVPLGRRPAPPVPPGASPDTVVGVDVAGLGRIGRALFAGTVGFSGRSVPLTGLNGYAVPQDGVAAFTPAWGSASRARTTCGSDTDPRAGCARDVVEIAVRDGRAVAVGPPGTGPIAPGTVVLVARDVAAVALRAVRPGDPVDARWTMAAPDTPPLRTAVAGLPLARAGRPLPGLQTTERAPRTAAGVSADGRRMYLLTVDGRQQASVGATLDELGRLVTELGVPDAVALDGGGSSQLVRRGVGRPLVVVNNPSEEPYRTVADGLGVLPTR